MDEEWMALSGDYREYPESNLISECLSGDDVAYVELSRRVSLCSQHQLKSLSAADRDDVGSIVLEKVYRNLASYDSSRGAFSTWINTIARGAVIDHVRSRRALSSPVSLEGNPFLLENMASSQWDDISHAYVQHARGMVLSTIDAVENDLLRHYLIGRYVMLLDDAFLAGLFEVSEGTVRSNLRRALNEFAALFIQRHPALSGIDFQALSNVLKDGAVPVTEEKLQAIEDPLTHSVMARVCLDRFSIARTAGDLKLSSTEIIAAIRKGIPELLRTKAARKAEVPVVAEPTIPYQTDVFPQSVENLILAAISFH